MTRDPETPFHEGMALDAVLRRIEERDGVQRDGGFDPEAQRHASPVDYCCKLGDELVALEHTGIEAFPGQIRGNGEAKLLFGPLIEQLKELAAPTECICLDIPIDATMGIKTKDVPTVRDALAAWIVESALTTITTPYGSRLRDTASVKPPGVPFEVSLHRFSAAHAMGGRFYFTRITGPIEEGRTERLGQTRDKKFGKLAVWKRNAAAHSILVLEDADMFLTNEQRVADTFARVEEGRDDQPDDVYVVTTYIEPWRVTCLRRAGKNYYDEGERFWEVDSSTLQDLTGR